MILNRGPQYDDGECGLPAEGSHGYCSCHRVGIESSLLADIQHHQAGLEGARTELAKVRGEGYCINCREAFKGPGISIPTDGQVCCHDCLVGWRNGQSSLKHWALVRELVAVLEDYDPPKKGCITAEDLEAERRALKDYQF